MSTLQAPDADAARRAAAEILSESRFRGDSPPRPFRGILQTIGRWLESLLRPVIDALERALGPSGTWVFVGAVVVAISVVAAAMLARRRPASAPPTRVGRGHHPRPDPAALEREAEAAEREGDFASAVRLLFRAGLTRLALAGTIDDRSSLTTGDVRSALALPDFDAVAQSFERIVYGRRPASATDAAEARDAWRRILGRSTR